MLKRWRSRIWFKKINRRSCSDKQSMSFSVSSLVYWRNWLLVPKRSLTFFLSVWNVWTPRNCQHLNKQCVWEIRLRVSLYLVHPKLYTLTMSLIRFEKTNTSIFMSSITIYLWLLTRPNEQRKYKAEDILSPDCGPKTTEHTINTKKNIAMTEFLVILYPAWRRSFIAIFFLYLWFARFLFRLQSGLSISWAQGCVFLVTHHWTKGSYGETWSIA